MSNNSNNSESDEKNEKNEKNEKQEKNRKRSSSELGTNAEENQKKKHAPEQKETKSESSSSSSQLHQIPHLHGFVEFDRTQIMIPQGDTWIVPDQKQAIQFLYSDLEDIKKVATNPKTYKNHLELLSSMDKAVKNGAPEFKGIIYKGDCAGFPFMPFFMEEFVEYAENYHKRTKQKFRLYIDFGNPELIDNYPFVVHRETFSSSLVRTTARYQVVYDSYDILRPADYKVWSPYCGKYTPQIPETIKIPKRQFLADPNIYVFLLNYEGYVYPPNPHDFTKDMFSSEAIEIICDQYNIRLRPKDWNLERELSHV